MFHQHIAHSLLERSRHIRFHHRLAFHMTAIQIIQHRGLHAAETEIVRIIRHPGLRKRNSLRIPLIRRFFNLRTAGIAKTDGPGHLVKSLSGSIVPGFSQNLIFSVIRHFYQMGMSAGRHKTEKRRFQIRMFNIVCRNMSLDMVHADQRKVPRKCDRLRLRNANQQRADQPRPVGHAHGVDIIQRHIRFFQRLLDNLVDLLYMFSRCDLRDHSTVQLMQVDL